MRSTSSYILQQMRSPINRPKNVLSDGVQYHNIPIFQDLVRPKSLDESSYNKLLECTKAHFAPKKSVSVERCRFFFQNHHPGETTDNQVAELRRLSEHCEFKEALDDMLRDCLVCGMNDQEMQRQLPLITNGIGEGTQVITKPKYSIMPGNETNTFKETKTLKGAG